ncbi:treslin isoform X2 [Erinaceus europaeus]|uniref:Treslin isoform X2 n=1 Tax=Erinaceus europaeus TaxID=9365 RepID=A0ABM3WFP2_ERIEU|nr:treslin isoform X2 [Erinaceus europaeus]
MACCHRVALLLDTAGGRDAGRRTALRLLAYLSCRLGLARLRWTFAFFDSQGARGRPARGADFGELSTRSWDSFEAALEARLFGPGAPLPGPEPRAVHTHEALLQALLDLQWDRPEIASPAKPARRPGGRRLLDAEAEAGDPAAHAVFLLAPCPHSQRELLRFVAGSEARARAPTREQLMDRLLPRRVQEALAARKITLCWVDTTEWTQLKDSPDHLGYWSVCELLRHVGGTVLPPEMFGQDFTKTAGSLLQSENKPFGEPHLSSWIPALPSDSTLTRLLYHSPQYEASFPRMEGMLFLPVEGKESQEAWAVILEPLAMQQRHFPKPVRIFLKGTVAPWAPPTSSTLVTESWMLHSPDSNRSADRLLFQQLVGRLTAEELHLVASVDPGEGWPPLSGVISPLSTTATILTVFCTEESGSQSHLHHTVVAEGSQDAASLFSSVLDVVLSQTHSPLEDSSPSAPPVPEWVQQELGRTAPWSTAVMETWFPFSNLSGASSELMESFWLLQAAPSQKEESSGAESELTQGLSEFYQKKSREESTVSNQDDSRKKHFKTEEELLSYIRESYQKTVVSRESVLHSCAQNSVSTMKAFLKSRGATDLEMSCINQIKNNLLKTSENLRQNLGKKLDKEDKVRECQLQVFLRLELCVQCPSIQESVDDLECVVEEVAALLRMVCLTEDSAYVAMFLEEILGLYIDSAPKTLGKLYDNLGFVIPQKLATALPVDFFSDDSLTQGNKSPLLSGPLPSSAHPSVPGSTESDQLEELRTRSAKKRRKNALMRHKSIAEVSQNLRQIEIPKASKRAAKSESSRPPRQPPLPVKELVQEVTKVRRNLFNQEMISPSKRSSKRGLPRSHSVSTVEGLDQNLDNFRKAKGYHRLLTKSVAETPVHKQISRRLLHRQIQGRSSDPGPEIDVVEESPEKGDNERILRRSPRIKQLSFMRTHSASFYSTAQPKSRSVQRVHSFQQDKSDQRENSPLRSIRSPKRLLFGAVTEMSIPSEKALARIQRPSGNTPGSEMSSAYQTPIKSSLKSPNSSKATSRRLPPTPQAPQCTPKRLQRPPAETTPAKRTLYKGALRERSSSGASPGQPEAALQKGHSLVAAEGASPQESRVPKVPPKPCAQPPGFSHYSTWPPSAISSPEGFCLAAPIPEQECLTPLGDLGETAFPGTPPSQKQQQACSPRVHPAEGPALKWEDGVAKAPSTPGNTSSLPERPWPDSPPPGQLGQNETCAAPSTPLRVSRGLKPDFSPPPPPSKTGKRQRKTSNPGRGSPECQPDISPALTGSGKPQEEAHPSPASPERHSFPDAGFWSRWCGSSPLLITSYTEPLTLLEEAECHDPGTLQRDVLLGVEGEGSETALADVKPSVSDTEVPPSPPGSLLRPSLVLQCSVENRQQQATSAPLLEGSANPQTYEVELGMQISGLPKLWIKKRKPSSDSQSEGEAPSREEGSMDEGGSLSSLGVPKGSKSCRPEATYLSPPCLLPAHSTPGKSGGQTYICQSCTPTHCPSGTSSPFQTDVGVPWTPSPKHNGKSTPESIRDWPRRKRAVDCGPAAGRGDPGAEPPEGDPESGIHRTSILGDLELEGVCQLPEQSPPWESVPQAEEATSWGQFGLGCRKRQSSAVEEAESQAKRICHPPGEDVDMRENEEQSPRGRGWPLLAGDDDVFAPGTTPPSSGTVRSCLSASGLQALTQSPLLFQGRTPSSRAADTRDEDVDAFPPSAEESPFSRAFSRKHPINRTYTRKKLIS